MICRSSFGDMEGLTGTIRLNGQQQIINRAMMRFERYTEAKEKSTECIEKVSLLM